MTDTTPISRPRCGGTPGAPALVDRPLGRLMGALRTCPGCADCTPDTQSGGRPTRCIAEEDTDDFLDGQTVYRCELAAGHEDEHEWHSPDGATLVWFANVTTQARIRAALQEARDEASLQSREWSALEGDLVYWTGRAADLERRLTLTVARAGDTSLAWMRSCIHVSGLGCCCPSREVACEGCPQHKDAPSWKSRAEAAESEVAALREQVAASDRELAALSSDKQTLMTAVTHWREQVEGLRRFMEGAYVTIGEFPHGWSRCGCKSTPIMHGGYQMGAAVEHGEHCPLRPAAIRPVPPDPFCAALVRNDEGYVEECGLRRDVRYHQPRDRLYHAFTPAATRPVPVPPTATAEGWTSRAFRFVARTTHLWRQSGRTTRTTLLPPPPGDGAWEWDDLLRIFWRVPVYGEPCTGVSLESYQDAPERYGSWGLTKAVAQSAIETAKAGDGALPPDAPTNGGQ